MKQSPTSPTSSTPTSPKTSIWFNQELLVNHPKPKKGTPKEATGRRYTVLRGPLRTDTGRSHRRGSSRCSRSTSRCFQEMRIPDPCLEFLRLAGRLHLLHLRRVCVCERMRMRACVCMCVSISLCIRNITVMTAIQFPHMQKSHRRESDPIPLHEEI